MIEIKYICDKCGSNVTREVMDVEDKMSSLLPEDWVIFEIGTPDETIVCQECVDWERMQNDPNW